MSIMYSANSLLMRHTTPPTYSHHSQSYYPEVVDESLNAPDLYRSNGASPESLGTTDPSPRRVSPPVMRSALGGPALLPKIRCQDQATEPTTTISSYHGGPMSSHGRALSMQIPHIRTSFGPSPNYRRRGTSPPEQVEMPTPISACSLNNNAMFSNMNPASNIGEMGGLPAPFGTSPSPMHTQLNSPISSNAELVHSRRSSMALVRTVSGPIPTTHRHKKTESTASSIDESVLMKHAYNAQFRPMPQYITAAPMSTPSPAPAPVMAAAVQPIDHFDVFSPVEGQNYLSADVPIQNTTSLARYLTDPGPRPQLVVRSMADQLKQRDFGWWDVRNLRQWSDFTFENIHSVDGFTGLLNCPIDMNSLPHSAAGACAPDTEFALRNIYADYFATRVTAALQVSTSMHHHLQMRACNSATTQHFPKPDFISHYEGDVLKTLRGEQRGHLVGIVKCYEEWNTSMRTQNAAVQVKYLRGLAQLHRIMREHGCRYGFIMTEIELVCVRAGAEDSEYYTAKAHGIMDHIDDGPRPIFGWLETSAAIPLSATGINAETGLPQLSVGLALWYLHMLAKDDPLPGQPPWKMDVGGPAAVTRHNNRPRDSWMPRVGVQESRVVKRLRGWVNPEDPFNRKEAPNMKRRGQA